MRICFLLALVACVTMAGCSRPPALVVSGAADNDLVRILGPAVHRVDTPAQAIDAAPEGGGVLVLADGYPDRPTTVSPALLEAAARKQLRVYVEFPASIPGQDAGALRTAAWERGVVTTDAFGPRLARDRIVMIHDGRFVAARADSAWLVMAKVAGFESAVFGLADTETWPVLFEADDAGLLIATTKLSQFVTARYAPAEAWTTIWNRILAWAAPEAGVTLPEWEPAVHPTYASDATLPPDAARSAVRRGADWYRNARMLMDASWADRYDAAEAFDDRTGPAPGLDLASGDGSLGVLEGFSSRIGWDGSQAARWWLRADCASETAMALALASRLGAAPDYAPIAANIQEFVYRGSPLQQATRADPASPDYGLVGWNTLYREVHYGDDNARVILGTLATAAVLDTTAWDEAMLRAILANYRTTGPDGFRGGRLEGPDIRRNGWRYYFNQSRRNYAPHYESWMWSAYLWLYDKTGYAPLRDRARRGIELTMAAYPDEWTWTNGLQQERARMLLPLAWLIRVDDTVEHRAWLDRIAADLLAHQGPTGAIQEELGSAGHGRYGPPASNADYGTTEAPLIQENGDPVADMLYTSNFAFLGLHEAAAATGDRRLAEARDRLAAFLMRIQVRAPEHPELDGAWFRAFDHRRWEYWASNADLGWGAWAVETGWTQSWITSVLALGELDTNLWDLSARSRVANHFDRYRASMLPGL
ncbi:MAG: hypothetical protein R2834_02825 [Rhodothermales bacterium]